MGKVASLSQEWKNVCMGASIEEGGAKTSALKDLVLIGVFCCPLALPSIQAVLNLEVLLLFSH